MTFDAKVWTFKAGNSGFSFYCYSTSISIGLISRCHADLETNLKSAPHQRSTRSGRAVHEQARQNSLSLFLKCLFIHLPKHSERAFCGRTLSVILPAPASGFLLPSALTCRRTRCHTFARYLGRAGLLSLPYRCS